MNIESGNKTTQEQLRKIFKTAAAIEIQNKEVAALMGPEDVSSPDVLPGGLRSRYGTTETKMYRSKKKKKDQAFMAMILRESIRQALIQINKIIEYHQTRIEEILKFLEETQTFLQELDKRHQSLEAELKFFQDKGLFDLDENGRLKNSKTEEILAGWERKTGKLIDRKNPASYEALLNILVDIEEHKIELRQGIENYSAEYEYHKAKLDEALQIRDDLENGDTMQMQNALLKFESFTNDRERSFDDSSYKEADSATKNDNQIEPYELLYDKTNNDFSFGFPPLKNNFTDAATDPGESAQNSAIKEQPMKKVSPIVKPGG